MADYGASRKYVFDYRCRNSRLYEIQAAVWSVKLKYLDNDNRRRRDIAMRYIKEVNNPLLKMPSEEYWHDNVFHIFPVLSPHRDALQQYLKSNGVGTMIHYPIPPHQQQCYAEWNERSLPLTEEIHQQELSLPCNQSMTDEEVEYVVNCVNAFVPETTA